MDNKRNCITQGSKAGRRDKGACPVCGRRENFRWNQQGRHGQSGKCYDCGYGLNDSLRVSLR